MNVVNQINVEPMSTTRDQINVEPIAITTDISITNISDNQY